MLDIDHFKKFNDTWGHQSGDEVLQLFAKSLRCEVRAGDTAARYGGEEFAVILPGSGLDEALRIANRIRLALAATRLLDRKTGKDVGQITTSIGAASFEPGEPLHSLIERADEALYRAKRAGRNRVVAACERRLS